LARPLAFPSYQSSGEGLCIVETSGSTSVTINCLSDNAIVERNAYRHVQGSHSVVFEQRLFDCDGALDQDTPRGPHPHNCRWGISGLSISTGLRRYFYSLVRVHIVARASSIATYIRKLGLIGTRIRRDVIAHKIWKWKFRKRLDSGQSELRP
jgi:hypothetical protein